MSDVSKFLRNPNFNLVKCNILLDSPKNKNSIDILCKWKSYQLFAHKSNMFLHYEYMTITIESYGHKKPKTAPCLQVIWTPCNTPFFNPTSFTTQNVSLIASCFLAQQCHKFSTAYSGLPHINPPKLSLKMEPSAPSSIQYTLEPIWPNTPNGIKISLAIFT